MSVFAYIYKNIVIFERGLIKDDILFNLLKDKTSLYFYDNIPFEYKTNIDKLLLIYDNKFFFDEDFHPIKKEELNLYLNPIIICKILVDDLNIKIDKFDLFKQLDDDYICNILYIVKEYFCKTIRSIEDYDAKLQLNKFVL